MPPKKRKKFIDKVVSGAIEYGIPTAIGAGLGALAGGPVGAVVGGGAALGSTIAGPKAAKALPEGTPDWARKATEYSIYGLAGGYGAGGATAARLASKALLPGGARAVPMVGRAFATAAFQRESAKLAAQTGAGAVVGGAIADELGVPDAIGEMIGSAAAPFSPAMFRGVRGKAFRSDSARMKGIAQAVGATEANSTRAAREVSSLQGRKVLGSSRDAAARARQQALHSRETASKLQPDLDEDGVAALTGGYSKAYLDLARRGRKVPPELMPVDVPPLERTQARSLWVELQKASTEQQTKYGKRTSALQGQADRMEGLADFLEANPDLGAPAPGMMAQASRNLAAVKASENLLEQVSRSAHKFIDMPRESVHNFEDYLKYAQYIAGSEPTPELQAAKLGEFFSSSGLRGSTWIATPDGMGIEPRHLVDIDLKKGVARVRGDFQAAEAADEIPLEAMRVRYNLDQRTALGTEVGLASQGYLGMADPATGLPMSAANVRQLSRGLPKAEPISGERYWATRRDYDQAASRAAIEGKPAPQGDRFVDEDIQGAWNQFNDNFVPADMTIEAKNLTPEALALHARGWRNVALRGPRAGSSPDERLAHVESQRWWRQSLEANNGAHMAVSDPEYRGMIEKIQGENPLDPRLPILYLAEQSTDDVGLLAKSDAIKSFGGRLGQYVERYGAGIVVQNPQVKAITQNYLGSLESSANFTAGTYQTVRTAAARLAKSRLGKTGGIKAGLKAAGRALPRPGRAIAAFIDETHPISDDIELTRLLRQEFKPENLRGRLGDQFRALDDADKAAASSWLTSQFRTLVRHPEAFPGLANDPEFSALRNAWESYDEGVSRGAMLLHANQQSKAREMSMLVERGTRSSINYDRVNAPEATLLDLFDEVKQANGGDLTRTAAALTHGGDADMAPAIAGYQSMAVTQFVEKLKGLAKPGETIGPNDLLFKGGTWQLRSLNKFPAELRGSLQGAADIVSGNHKWEGLQQLSQQIAMGNLAADMSLLGIQGFKYMAHSVLAGKPLKAFEVIGRGLTHIMTDYGFHSWMRQNMDEVMYYSSRGLTGGLKGYVAGPDINKLPLERLPFLGKVFTGIREGNDLQFNRALYYWKVEAVRDNLDVARQLRSVRGQVSDKFLKDLIESSPSLKGTADDMGGLESYLLGANEETVDAVIRQVQRSMGGVNLQAEGVSANRQALEQIGLIVPGFFRAQVGQWASVITKPHTLEGHLALSMLAREYMFAGSIAVGMSRLMGTEDRINFDDITKPTWLGVPMPEEVGGGTFSLLPTMGLPRLASRVIRETVAAAGGDDANFDTVLESFARGRLSPLVSAAYDNMEGEDFLGRKRDGVLEKWGYTLSSLTLPIVLQSAGEDIHEGLKQYSATGEFDPAEFAATTGANILGKSIVPRHPADRLNLVAKSAYGTDWNLLTDVEKYNLRKDNPAATAAEAEYDFYNSRRAGSAESHIDSAYKQYQVNVDRVWQEPTSIDGLTSDQGQDDVWLAQGTMTGETWRDRYHTRQQAVSQWFEGLQQQLKADGLNPDEVRQKRLERLKEGRPEDRAVLIQLARAEYTAVKPPSETREVSTPEGVVTQEVMDWDGFAAEREAVLSKYPSEIRDAIRRSVRANELPGLEAYRQASVKQREIESLGRYRGLSSEQGDKVDRMRAIIAKVGDAVRGQAGGAGSIPAGVIQQMATSEMVRSGVVKDEGDMRLVAVALAMAKSPQLAATMANPAQVQAILGTPDVAIWYPYLKWRVPRALWPQLPEQVFNAPLMEAQLAAS